MAWTHRILLAFLMISTAACGPKIDACGDGTGVIIVGPAGGLCVRNGASIDVPPNALSSERELTVSILNTSPQMDGRTRISRVYVFSPAPLTFNLPVQIILPWEDDMLPYGADPGAYQMHRNAAGTSPVDLSSSVLSAEHRLISAQTETLGQFWLTAPSAPSLATLTLEPELPTLQPGAQAQLTAKVTDETGNARTEVEIRWSVVPARVATISDTGTLQILSPGNATVIARSGDLEARQTVRVQGNTTGPSSFIHDNPFPTGNDLLGGVVSSGSAVFVGTHGTVLSLESPEVWTRRFSSPGVVWKAASGQSTGALATVGVYGTQGVIAEVSSAQATPAIQQFPNFEPRAVWFNGTHGMAVGFGNDVILRKNGMWRTADSPSFETLLDVQGDGAGGFTTVGSRGSLYRYSPSSDAWDSLYQTQLNVLLTHAVFLPTSDVQAWAIGGTALWHHGSGTWTRIALPQESTVTELTALGLIDGKVILGAKAGSDALLLTYNPQASTQPWSSQTVRSPQIIRAVISDGAEGYAVGDLGAVWRYGPMGFTELSHGFYGNISDISLYGNTVLVASNECVTSACLTRQGTVMKRVAANQWAPVGVPNFPGIITAVLALNETDVLAASGGNVYRFNGTVWSEVPLNAAAENQSIEDLQRCGSVIRAVGSRGLSYRGTTQTLMFQPQQGLDTLYSISCDANDDEWIAGDFALYENRILRSSRGVNQAEWRAVWSPAPGEAFVVGDARYGLYWDTQSLIPFENPGGVHPDVLSGLWGSSIDNLYAVGHTVVPFATGVALRFNGADWQAIDPGAQRRATAITGTSATQLWIGTEGGGVLRGVTP